MVTLNINGRDVQVDADPSTPILWALRDNLNMTGTKFGCGAAFCGACTVLMSDVPVRSCSLPVSAVGDGAVGPITRQLLAAWSELVGVDIVAQGLNQLQQKVIAYADPRPTALVPDLPNRPGETAGGHGLA